ncbi:MAG: class I SAM-dependent methyltransferase [Nannocystaceae bacterium]
MSRGGSPRDLQDVPATALLTLWARAVETRSKDPLLVDEHAVAALERLDFDVSVFDQLDPTVRETTVAGTVVRAAQIDAIVRRFVAEHPGGRVVSLGCGLDSRSRRLDDGMTRWLDVDLPEMIAIRRQLFEPTARHRMMAASMFDDAVMAELSARDDRGLLIVCEGVLLYLRGEQVESWLIRLAREVPRATLVFDVVGTRLCDEHHPAVLAMQQDAPVEWGIDDPAALSHLHPALRLVEHRSVYDCFEPRWRALADALPTLRERVGQGVVTLAIDGGPHDE